MSVVWITIAGLAVGTIAIKAVGPVSVGGTPLPERATAVIALFAPALLAALVLVETFGGDGKELTVDARLGGLAAAAAALALRLPVLVVVLVAAATAAGLRALA